MLFGFTTALLYWVFLDVLALVLALALFLPVGAIFERKTQELWCLRSRCAWQTDRDIYVVEVQKTDILKLEGIELKEKLYLPVIGESPGHRI